MNVKWISRALTNIAYVPQYPLALNLFCSIALLEIVFLPRKLVEGLNICDRITLEGGLNHVQCCSAKKE